jgi:hypothetical protein
LRWGRPAGTALAQGWSRRRFPILPFPRAAVKQTCSLAGEGYRVFPAKLKGVRAQPRSVTTAGRAPREASHEVLEEARAAAGAVDPALPKGKARRGCRPAAGISGLIRISHQTLSPASGGRKGGVVNPAEDAAANSFLVSRPESLARTKCSGRKTQG